MIPVQQYGIVAVTARVAQALSALRKLQATRRKKEQEALDGPRQLGAPDQAEDDGW